MNLIYIITLFPFIGFLFLSFFCNRISENTSAYIGITSIFISMITTIKVAIDFFINGKKEFVINLWKWIEIQDFNVNYTFRLDSLSLIMLLVITVVGFIIHIFSSWYMSGKKEYTRFFSYMNLFVFSMIILVLANNLFFMYFGWEAIGICSYLLIGFYYQDKKNGISAIKAMIFTKIGDVFLLFSLFLIYYEFKTLNIKDLSILVDFQINKNYAILESIAFMILFSAISKSAQIPFHTWLPSAMVGPTPVSALIHAATMVTAGIYLISRMNFIFTLTPRVLFFISIISSFTLLYSSFYALIEKNLKKILAYSTISQLSYMFLALSIRSWNAAIFHLITHAFFKALLFLSAGVVILLNNDEKNIYKMKSTKNTLIYLCFLISGSSLSAIPMTSGYFSKEKILIDLLDKNIYLLLIAILGAFLTTLYTFRMIFIIFNPKLHFGVFKKIGISYYVPLITLSILSTYIGYIVISPLENIIFTNYYTHQIQNETIVKIFSSVVNIFGIFLSFIIWKRKKNIYVSKFKLFISKFDFDVLYKKIFVKSYYFITKNIKYNFIKNITNFFIFISFFINKCLSLTINGYLRWYVVLIALGMILLFICII